MFSATNKQSDYTSLSPSLAHRSSIILNFCVAPGIRKAELGVLYTPKSYKDRFLAWSGKIFKDLKPLEQRPALAASWQSVFGFLYWGARLEEPGHNRSRSPFTTRADIAERRVASTGAGQPNYWPNTWFRADAYNAISSGCHTIKSVRTLLLCYGVHWSPWRTKRTRMYGCDL